jgi:hypothetical protein
MSSRTRAVGGSARGLHDRTDRGTRRGHLAVTDFCGESAAAAPRIGCGPATATGQTKPASRATCCGRARRQASLLRKAATSTSTSADIVIEFAPVRPRPVIPHRALAHTR